MDEPVHSRWVACSVALAPAAAAVDGVVVHEHLQCTVEMSNPMAGGDLSAEITVTYQPASASAGAWTGTFTIAGDVGTWRGTGHGAAVRPAGDGPPALYGQVEYEGSDGCAGLSYRQLLAGESSPTSLSGLIGGPAVWNPHWRIAYLPSLWVDAITLGGGIL